MELSDISAMPAADGATTPGEPERMCILVAGMHRSGTSAVTRMISLLGADLPQNLMPARHGNMSGHWEPERITDLDDEILASANTSLYDVSAFPRGWYQSAAELEFRRRMVALLEEEYGDSSMFVLKDPRASRLIPFWLSTFEAAKISPSFVLCVRNPLEAARSLSERDDESLHRGLLMWLRHTLEAERETRAHPRAIVSYGHLLSDWEGVAVAIGEALEISWPRLSNRTRIEIGQFIKAGDRHYEVSDLELEAHRAVVSWVKLAWAELSRAAETQEAPDPRLLDALTDLVDDADRAYGPLIGELELSLSQRERERDEALKTSDEEEREAKRLAAKLAETESSRLEERETAVNRIHALEGEVWEASKRASMARAEVRSREREVRRLEASLDDLRGVVEERERAIEGARDETASTRTQLEAAMQERDARAAEIVRLQSSLELVREEAGAAVLAARPAGRLRSFSQLCGWIIRGRFHDVRTVMRLRRTRQFDSNLYLARYPDVLARRLNPLMHYVAHGAWESRDPNRRFESAAYLASHMDLYETRENPFLHHLRTGEEATPLDAVADLPAPRMPKTPRWRSARTLFGWLLKGRFDYIRTFRALRRSGHFDAGYYLACSPDIREQRANPLMHYIAAGARECRDPSRVFRTNDYLIAYPELADTGENPLLHWVRHGGPSGAVLPASTGGGLANARSRPRRGRAGAEVASLAADILSSGGSPLVLRSAVAEVPAGASPFPRADDGSDPGSRGSTAAIANLEALRASGASHLIIPAEGKDWLAERPDAKTHIESRYPVTDAGRFCTVYSIASAELSPTRAVLEFCENYRWRHREFPSILDLTGALAREGIVTSTVVFEPSGAGPDSELPYLTDSVDAVIVPNDASPAAVAEARRVARTVLASTDTNRGADLPLDVDWLRGPDAPSPSVSIVIPSYNGAELLSSCMRSLRETIPSALDVEVVISDDASTDGTADFVASFESAFPVERVVADRNSGFVDACNRGAAVASGQILVFLNNDTLALPGWLSALACVLRDEPEAGVAGGRLVFGDGRLQEAGGVIFSDGTGANYGRHSPDPDGPLFEVRRPVHYVSGALLATPADLFESLGGFGAEFAPGYYEDTDYCFKAREAGMRVLYEPRATVVHLEGRTAGTDEAGGMKRHQAINKERFRERWASVLAGFPEPPSAWDNATWHALSRAGRQS